MASAGAGPNADTETETIPTPEQAPSRNPGFVEAWESALVARWPRLKLPREGFRGVFAVTTVIIVLTVLAASAITVPKAVSGMGFGDSHREPRPNLSAPERTDDREPSSADPADGSDSPGPAWERAGALAGPEQNDNGRSIFPGASASPESGRGTDAGESEPSAAAPTPEADADEGEQDSATGGETSTTAAPPVAAQSTKGIIQTSREMSSGRTVTLQAKANGRYVRTEVKYGGTKSGMLRAVSTEVADWEKFTLVWVGSRGGWALRSNHTGLYVSADQHATGDNSGMVRGLVTTAGDWEMFAIYRFGDGTYSLRSFVDGKFVTAEADYSGDRYGMLRAQGGTIGSWERFYLS